MMLEASLLILLIAPGSASRIRHDVRQDISAADDATEVIQSNTSGCSKIMWRSLCKEYGNYILEGLSGMVQDDLDCIATLCSKHKKQQCCGTITTLTNVMKGQSPDTLHIKPDAFNRLAALTDGAIAAVDASDVHKNKPKGKKYVPPPKKKIQQVEEVEQKPDAEKWAWASEYGWDLDASGKFHYSSGGKKADASVVPDGCHEYFAVDHCFSPKQGDAWVLGKARNMKLNELQCIGYLCAHMPSDITKMCCGTLLGLKTAINGHNWYDKAEYEESWEKFIRATGEYLP
jgi:hypothetical protein